MNLLAWQVFYMFFFHEFPYKYMLILVLFNEFQEEIMYLFCSVSLYIHWITVRNSLYVVLTWNVEGIACACVINLHWYYTVHAADMADYHCACTYICYCIVHTADLAHYHCALYLTSGIAFTCIWYGGLSLCPCTCGISFTYIWYGGLLLCPCTYIWYCVVHALDDRVCNFSCRFVSCNCNRHI